MSGRSVGRIISTVAAAVVSIGVAISSASVATAQILADGKPRIEMEIAIDPGLAANTAATRWAQTLSDLGVANVRFRSLKNGDKIEVQPQGAGAAAFIQITAQMNNRGTLLTPGGQFNPSDSAKLGKWLAEVQSGGGVPGQRKTVFGLTPEQFEQVKKSLAAPVTISTKGKRPEKVIDEIKTAAALPLVVDPGIERALLADEPVRDELQGLSVGTALAAIARPAGGVLVPRPAGRQLQLAITTPPPGGDVWPIGWPPEERDEQKLAPALYEFIPVEIDGISAAKAIDVLASRIKIPMLFDYNGLARQRIDLSKNAKVPPSKSYYRQILERVLNGAKLKSEVRVDDAGKPLIWITPL